MSVPWVSLGRPLVFAHRGGRALGPENTLAGFDGGAAAGADGLELDVHLARDGEVVVCHDATLDRTTDASGRLCDFTSSELARVDAGCRFTAPDGTYPFRARGIGIPRLGEVLRRYPELPLVVEMKDDLPSLAEATVSLIREAGAARRVCLGSFSRGVLRTARRLAPEIATSGAREEVRAALIGSWFGLFPVRPVFQALQVPEGREGFRVVTPRFLRAAHRRGIPIQVWVVNDEADMRRLLEVGVDGLITDHPDKALAVVSRVAARR